MCSRHKELVTPEMINRFVSPKANLSDLYLTAICVTAYSAFLRYELADLRCCDISFCDAFVKIYVFKSNLNRCSLGCSLHFHKLTFPYGLRSTGMSYTRTREIVLRAFAELGYRNHLFGLHSLRAGGVSAAANAGVSDRLFSITADGRQIEPRTLILSIM